MCMFMHGVWVTGCTMGECEYTCTCVYAHAHINTCKLYKVLTNTNRNLVISMNFIALFLHITAMGYIYALKSHIP